MRIETFPLGELRTNAYLVFDESPDAERPGQVALALDPGDRPQPLIARLGETGAALLAILLTHGHWDHVNGVRELKAAFDVPVYLHEADRFLYDHVLEQAALLGLQADPRFRAGPQPPVDHSVADGDIIELGPFRISVLHTPGHSPGGVCYRLQGAEADPSSTGKEAEPGAEGKPHAAEMREPAGRPDAAETREPASRADAPETPEPAGRPGVVFVGDTIFAGGVGRCDLPGGSFEQLLDGILQKILTLDDNVTLYPGHGPSTTVGTERHTNPFLA
jgi:hydroxyacylglutathione hydrolase